MFERLSQNVYALDVAIVEPSVEYVLYTDCEPLEFISLIESGTITLIFTYKLIIEIVHDPLSIKERDRKMRPASDTERLRYLENYRRFCREGKPNLRRLFFEHNDYLEINAGFVQPTEKFLSLIQNEARKDSV